MNDRDLVRLTLDLNSPDLDPDEVDQRVLHLLREFNNSDEVENARQVVDSSPPKGSKAFGGILLGLLQAEVNLANAKSVFRFLGDRLGGQPIAMEVEANGKKLKVTASSQQEFLIAIQAAEKFISG